MARPRKKTEKIYDLGNFKLLIDIYKKKVVYFKLIFNVERDTNEIIPIDKLNNTLKELLKEKFKYINGRKIYDVGDDAQIRGYQSHIELKGFFEIFEDYEERIKVIVGSMLPQIEEIFNEMGFRCTKSIRKMKRKKNGILEGNTEL